MTVRTDYVARTARGAVIATFDNREQAMAWADVEGERFPGWTVSALTEVIVRRERVLRRDRGHARAAT